MIIYQIILKRLNSQFNFLRIKIHELPLFMPIIFSCCRSDRNSDLSSPYLLSSGVGVPGVILLMFLFALWYHRRRRAAPNTLTRNISCEPFSKFDPEDGGMCFEVPVFSYVELETATNKFDHDKELGDGGFGTVYHGKRKTLFFLFTFVELGFKET